MDPVHSSTATAPPHLPVHGPSAVSLADALGRKVPFHWYESVAILAGLCATLVEHQISGVPQPEAVSLTADGQVRVKGGARLLATAALPKLLEALLAGSSTPAPLRVFVLHAMAPGSTTSIDAFRASLEYYERPERQELLQAAYQRVLETPADATGEKSREIRLEDDRPAPPLPDRRRRIRVPVAAVALLLCAGCAAVAYVIAAAPHSSAQGLEGATRNARSMMAGIEEVARTVTTAVQEKVAAIIGTSGAPEPARHTEPSAVPARARARGAAVRRAGRLAAAPPQPAGETVADDPPMANPGIAPLETEPEPLVAFPFANFDGTVIYSSHADQVAPPVLRDPHRLPGSLQVATEGPSNAVEILISETGTVERVTMVRPSTHLTDMMLLGAAKTWEFEPATRDGAPVKFRLRLDWVDAQR